MATLETTSCCCCCSCNSLSLVQISTNCWKSLTRLPRAATWTTKTAVEAASVPPSVILSAPFQPPPRQIHRWEKENRALVDVLIGRRMVDIIEKFCTQSSCDHENLFYNSVWKTSVCKWCVNSSFTFTAVTCSDPDSNARGRCCF